MHTSHSISGKCVSECLRRKCYSLPLHVMIIFWMLCAQLLADPTVRFMVMLIMKAHWLTANRILRLHPLIVALHKI